MAEQIERVPPGQVVAVTRVDGAERSVGTATTMRTRRPPFALPLTWGDAIGGHGLPNHDPAGVEVSVRWRGETKPFFVVNHTDAEQTVTLGEEVEILLAGADDAPREGVHVAGAALRLAPYGVLVAPGGVADGD